MMLSGLSFIEIVTTLVDTIRTTPANEPANIIQVNLQREVLAPTLKAAEKAEIDLGAPITRPVGHAEYLDWYAAIAAHRALSMQREKSRKPLGPPRAKGKDKAKTRPKTRGQHRRASKSAMLTAE